MSVSAEVDLWLARDLVSALCTVLVVPERDSLHAETPPPPGDPPVLKTPYLYEHRILEEKKRKLREKLIKSIKET